MKAADHLTMKLCKHFPIHPSRKFTLCSVLMGIMAGGNVHQVSAARYLDSGSPKSALRRVERFFQKEVLRCSDFALSAIQLLNFKGKFDLCIDRTNWKFGDKNTNYLVLSWRISKQISIPLFFVELDKAGNSNTSERISLLDEFDAVFGFERIKSLMADREFIGKHWIETLIKHGISFYIRIKENTLVPYGEDPIHVGKLFNHLESWQTRLVEKDMYGSTVCFAGARSKSGELVIVMSNCDLTAKKILGKYRKRWSIEELFGKLKTNGLNWENTHMKDSKRLVTLLIIMSMAALLLYYIGLNSHGKTAWKKTLNCPQWSLFKIGLINFQRIATKGINTVIKYLTKACNNLNVLLEC